MPLGGRDDDESPRRQAPMIRRGSRHRQQGMELLCRRTRLDEALRRDVLARVDQGLGNGKYFAVDLGRFAMAQATSAIAFSVRNRGTLEVHKFAILAKKGCPRAPL
jgi:hypothetical protein